ncbi:forkhead box protein D5-C-like isoform X2 [Mercenaria mercenaria]|nr:forkhead box protein D5-C-like isoform X2 [Mercenaria mercenaria]
MYQEKLILPALSSAIDCDVGTGGSSSGALKSGDTVIDNKTCKDGHVNKQKKRRMDGNKSANSLNSELNMDSDLKSPGLSYIALISMAIQSSDSKKMLLSEIYHWISEHFPYYQMKDKSWRNSIRHNLSLNECFVKSGRSENGKGNYWSIHPANIEDFSKGDYRRRRARRQVRKCDEDLQRLCSNSPEVVKPPTPTSTENNCHDGYVPMISTIVPSNFLAAMGVEPAKSYEYWYPNTCPQPEDCKKSVYHPSNLDYKDSAKAETTYSGTNVPYYGRCFNRDNYNVTSPAESTVNVNVNVNVCGNTESNRPECYPYLERHFSSLSSQNYGQYWQDSYDQTPYYG